MAVQEDDYVKKTYFSIYDGKVVRQWFQDEKPEGFSNVTKRVTPESKRIVWYKPYIFSGKLTDIFEKKNENLNQYEVHLVLDGDSVLVFKSQSGYHKSFLLAMQNFPKGEELTFSPYNFKDREKDKRIIGMTIKDSEGNKIIPFYTKDDPKKLPQPKKNKKGEWNWTAVEDFLDNVFDEWYVDYFAEVDNITVNDAEDLSSNKDKDVPF